MPADPAAEGVVPRLMVFSDQPLCLVLYLPEGMVASLPPLAAPFVKKDVSDACAQNGLDVRVSEGRAGHWTRALARLQSAERNERAQRHRLAEVDRIAELTDSPETSADAARAAAIARKHEVDDRIRTIKSEIGRVKARAYTSGKYLPPEEYRKMKGQLAALQAESLALQNRLGELRAAAHAERMARDRTERVSYAERFMRAADVVLPDDLLQSIHDLARDE